MDDLMAPDMVIQLGVQPNRVDLLTSISAVTFEEAWAGRLDAELLRNKDGTGRAKDQGDAEELRKLGS